MSERVRVVRECVRECVCVVNYASSVWTRRWLEKGGVHSIDVMPFWDCRSKSQPTYVNLVSIGNIRMRGSGSFSNLR